MKYRTIIGLEVHVQLLTKSKIFCSCSNTFGRLPNSSVCPVCLGLPGSLPVLNKEVINLSIKAALALNCKINSFMRFDRKNYFYPDLPKGYQISQFDMPLASNGHLDITGGASGIKSVTIRRIHLEEDAGKLIHTEKGSLVDFNRCGVPLIEIVTEPDINSPDEAYNYLVRLKRILNYLEVSDCNMQEGSLRCDANISINLASSDEMGVKTEVKNLNSFKAVKNALTYEIKRQKELYEKGQRIIQETRLWDENKKKTFSMRTKEEAYDYRYFPEPDLPKFEITKEQVTKIRQNLPELPSQRKERLIRDYHLSEYDAQVLISNKSIADYFETSCKIYHNPKIIANWLMGPVSAILKSRNESFSEIKVRPDVFCQMLSLIKEGRISNNTAKEVVLPGIIDGKRSLEAILGEKDIRQVSDKSQLTEIIDKVIRENPKPINDYKQGKGNVIMYLVGQIMRYTKGKANPKVVNELLTKRLKGG